jgi:short-subunit dehydrogenase
MKQVTIVGGGGGLGSKLVEQLLDRDYRVTVVGRTRPKEPRLQNFLTTDVTHTDWRSLYATIEKLTGAPISAVVFVAGTAAFGRTAQIPPERARQTFELNFWACTSAATAAAEYWSEARRPGKFLAILSIVARHAVPLEAYYSASKAAAARFLESLQFEYAGRKIELMSVFPGMLKTPFRRRAEWYGVTSASDEQGADVQQTSRAIIRLLEGRRRTRVIGWRERSIDVADHVLPGVYDRVVLRARARKLLAFDAVS